MPPQTVAEPEVVELPFGFVKRDQFIFVLVHVASILCAIAFYLAKNRRLLGGETLHKIAGGLGIVFITVLFGSSVLYMLLQVGLAWMILCTVRDSRSAAVLILIDSIAILGYLHIKRMMLEDPSTVDFTAPIMISTQKLTSLAFNLHDHTRKDKEPLLPEENRRLMVAKRPSLLQLVSFIFFFHGVVVGPLSFYSEYIYFMEEQPANFKAKGRKRALLRHLALTLVLMAAVLVLVPRLPPQLLLEDDFQERSFVVRLAATYFVMLVARFKYYFAWNLGSCIQLAAGYGYDKQKADWTGIKNVSIVGVELATSPKSYIDGWNMSTNAWLRLVAHSRLPRSLKLPGTFVLSAMWHGFYPGYYFTFLFAVPVTLAARRVRRRLRPRFLAAGQLPLYHVITWVGTQLVGAYAVVPFTLLHLDLVMAYYSGTMHWAGHVTVLAVLAATFVVPAAASSSGAGGSSAKQSQTLAPANEASNVGMDADALISRSSSNSLREKAE